MSVIKTSHTAQLQPPAALAGLPALPVNVLLVFKLRAGDMPRHVKRRVLLPVFIPETLESLRCAGIQTTKKAILR